jgi:hypothetical protein
MNPDGSQHGTIDDVVGASGVALVHGILFVARSGSGEIARFDLSTEPPTQSLARMPMLCLSEFLSFPRSEASLRRMDRGHNLRRKRIQRRQRHANSGPAITRSFARFVGGAALSSRRSNRGSNQTGRS